MCIAGGCMVICHALYFEMGYAKRNGLFFNNFCICNICNKVMDSQNNRRGHIGVFLML